MTARAASRMRLDQEDLRPQMRMPWLTPLLGTFLRKMPAQIMPTGAGTLTYWADEQSVGLPDTAPVPHPKQVLQACSKTIKVMRI